MAQVLRFIGRGDQRFAESNIKWNRRTIRKGQYELQSVRRVEDRFLNRGRKRAEHHLPHSCWTICSPL